MESNSNLDATPPQQANSKPTEEADLPVTPRLFTKERIINYQVHRISNNGHNTGVVNGLRIELFVCRFSVRFSVSLTCLHIIQWHLFKSRSSQFMLPFVLLALSCKTTPLERRELCPTTLGMSPIRSSSSPASIPHSSQTHKTASFEQLPTSCRSPQRKHRHRQSTSKRRSKSKV